MKYVFLALMAMMFCGEAQARPSVTLDANETLVIATIGKGVGLWQGTVKMTGTFGGGTLTLIHAQASNCTSRAVTLPAYSGTAYSATAADIVTISLGTKPDADTFVCAKILGATNPSVLIEVMDGR